MKARRRFGLFVFGLALASHAAAEGPDAGALAHGEAALAEQLEALASCDGKKSSEDCAPRDAWKKRVDAVSATDESAEAGKVERRRLAKTCVARLKHASAGVREAAATCLGETTDHIPDRKQATQVILSQYAVDTAADARAAELGALRRLNPTEHGLAGDVIALARKLLGKPTARKELAALVDALAPTAFGPDIGAAPEAVTFALELLKRREAVGDAVAVLHKAKSPAADVCAALLDLAETKRGHWAEAIHALGADEVRCKEQRQRAVEIVLEVAKRPAGPGRKLGLGEAAATLGSFVRDSEPSAAQRAILREALKLAEETEGRAKLEPLRERLVK